MKEAIAVKYLGGFLCIDLAASMDNWCDEDQKHPTCHRYLRMMRRFPLQRLAAGHFTTRIRSSKYRAKRLLTSISQTTTSMALFR